MISLTLFQKIIIWAIPILFAITVHEVAHGWVANKLGDATAKMMGRLTLNPIKHIDPIGTILVPGILLVIGGFMFGWAKPVPITWQNLRNPKRDMALVALAGPLSNLVMALAWATILKLCLVITADAPPHSFFLFIAMCYAGIVINLMLMVLNLLPVPPLDGSRVVATFLTGRAAYFYHRIEPFGLFILLGLLTLGLFKIIIFPIVTQLNMIILSLFGIA
ncbi:MAG: site-2 protease family protein [Gammaproteobacteria bacterium]|nr:site-2 protease family protein [Gammaproteobacteria bacterium]